jgi:DHA1 family multidrug resistance protein-like MFS transporter
MAATYIIQFGYNFAVVGPVMLIPLMARSFGASSAVIGLIVATYQAVIFLSSGLFGRLSDMKGHKLFIVVGLLLAAGTLFAHRYITSVPSAYLIRALTGLAVGIFPAAVVAYASRQTENLGRFSGIGSLGWGVGSIVAGLIAVYNHLFLLAAVVFLITAVVALIAIPESRERLNQPFFNTQVIKRNWRVYFSFFLRHAGATGIWAIYPLYLSQLGASNFWIGIIYAINAFGQFAFMSFLDRYKTRLLIQLGFISSVVTFVSFAFCRNYKQLLPLQVILAFAWSCLYVGSLKYLIEHNDERSTAVGMFNSTLSLSGIVGAVLGGALAVFGLPVVMLAAAALSVAGVFVFRF